jgi:hypothetical protein
MKRRTMGAWMALPATHGDEIDQVRYWGDVPGSGREFVRTTSWSFARRRPYFGARQRRRREDSELNVHRSWSHTTRLSHAVRGTTTGLAFDRERTRLHSRRRPLRSPPNGSVAGGKVSAHPRNASEQSGIDFRAALRKLMIHMTHRALFLDQRAVGDLRTR